MGFSEDDRIRVKNKIHNEAFEIYENLKYLGYDNELIIKYAAFASQVTKDSFRNDIYTEVIKIVRRLDEARN